MKVDRSGVKTTSPLDQQGGLTFSLDKKLLAKYYVVQQTSVYGMFTKVGWESLRVMSMTKQGCKR